MTGISVDSFLYASITFAVLMIMVGVLMEVYDWLKDKIDGDVE